MRVCVDVCVCAECGDRGVWVCGKKVEDVHRGWKTHSYHLKVLENQLVVLMIEILQIP